MLLFHTNAVVATARDTADPSKGLKFGDAYFLVRVDHHISPFAIATGTIAGTLRVLGLGPDKLYRPGECPKSDRLLPSRVTPWTPTA